MLKKHWIYYRPSHNQDVDWCKYFLQVFYTRKLQEQLTMIEKDVSAVRIFIDIKLVWYCYSFITVININEILSIPLFCIFGTSSIVTVRQENYGQSCSGKYQNTLKTSKWSHRLFTEIYGVAMQQRQLMVQVRHCSSLSQSVVNLE